MKEKISTIHKPPRAISPARRAAFEILRRVAVEDAFASVLLAQLEDEALSVPDRALCYELVTGVLRRQLWLDAVVTHYAKRAADKLDLPVLLALRIALYQLRFLSRVPSSAAVNESVNLIYQARLRSAAPFVNAVLRRATREPEFDPTALLSKPLEKLALETSHPVWLLENWQTQFGFETTNAIAHSNNERPPTAFRIVRRAEAEKVLTEIDAAGIAFEPSRVAPEAWRVLKSESVNAGEKLNALMRAGKIYLQDEASQLVAHTLAPRAGEKILDACAAPGSKTTLLTSLANDGAEIFAIELHKSRADELHENIARQGWHNVKVFEADATRSLPFAAETFDAVLVDAPCSGTGTLRRNPELRYRLQPADIVRAAETQRALLRAVAPLVRVGGRIIYSTCSLETTENENVISEFLAIDERYAAGNLTSTTAREFMTARHTARIMPQQTNTEGFFVAACRRRC